MREQPDCAFVSLAEAIAGGRPQPNTLAVTFDDGCLSTLKEALPILVKHKVKAHPVHRGRPHRRFERMGHQQGRRCRRH